MNSKKMLPLLLAPLAYFFLGSYILQIAGFYSLHGADPECIYFISGLSVANGKMILGHIDNPGTPLQYLAALVFRLVYFLRSHQVTFNHDAFANPDMYLHVLNLVLTSVVAVFMYFAGKIFFKISNNLTYTILIQLSPLFASIIFLNIGRVVPENLLPIPVMLLSILILRPIFVHDDNRGNNNSLWFGLISAFGLSIKLTYFPLWIIPIIILTTWKERIKYSLIAVISFLVMALPVTLQINIFWGWIKALFLHSGKYGDGEGNIIDMKTFGPNFSLLWNDNQLFFWTMIILLLVFITSFKYRNNTKSGLIQRTSLALICAAGIQTFIVCKQYEARYFVPALMLIPSSVILIAEFSRQFDTKITKYKIPQIVLTVLISAYFIKQVPAIRDLSADLDQKINKKMQAMYYMNTIEKDAVKIVVTSDYGAPVPEYILMHSYEWSGRQRALFKPTLAEIYPNSYIFFPWDNTMHFWGKEPDFKNTDQPTYIYFFNNTMKESFFLNAAKYFPEKYELIQTFFNEENGNVVYKLAKAASE
jgi:hypothetical protein